MIKKTTIPFIFIMILIINLGCDKYSDTLMSPEGVIVVTENEDIYVENRTQSTVYYAIFPRDILPLINWAPCTDPDQCEDKIHAYNMIKISYQTFLGEEEDDEAVFYWWHLIPKSRSGYEPDIIHDVVIQL